MKKFQIAHFSTVSPELIRRLIPYAPKHWKVGQAPKLPTFLVTSSDNMMPTVVKIRDRAVPRPGEVYLLIFNSDPSVKFVDERTGKECTSRDRLIVHLYVPQTAADAQGELRFFTSPMATLSRIEPEPVAVQTVFGIREVGTFWIAAPGVEYTVEHQEMQDQLLFAGSVAVSLGVLPEEARKGGAVKIRAGKLDVYDRRADRLSSFARAEHIRRTIGGRRTFEFVNLRDLTAAEAAEDPPEHLLSAAGIETI